MIVTTLQLKEYYSDYADPKGKILRDIKNGKLFPLIKGLYETDPNAYAPKLAQFIYGPSYISFDYILHERGLIPEAVYRTITCATFNKRKIKTYKNRFGTFTYRDVPDAVFSLGVIAITDDHYSYQVATPEKALCDKLYTLSPVKNIKELENMLFEDLRIDEDMFNELSKEDIVRLAPLYRCKNLLLLSKYMEKK